MEDPGQPAAQPVPAVAGPAARAGVDGLPGLGAHLDAAGAAGPRVAGVHSGSDDRSTAACAACRSAQHLRGQQANLAASAAAGAAHRGIPGRPGRRDARRDRPDALAAAGEPPARARMGGGRRSGAPSGTRRAVGVAPDVVAPALALVLGLVVLTAASPRAAAARCRCSCSGRSRPGHRGPDRPAAPWRRGASMPADRARLRRVARKTWRFFETSSPPEDNGCRRTTTRRIARALVRRTSPTNIGLQLLSALAARDFGYLDVSDLVERLERTIGTLARMARYRGHSTTGSTPGRWRRCSRSTSRRSTAAIWRAAADRPRGRCASCATRAVGGRATRSRRSATTLRGCVEERVAGGPPDAPRPVARASPSYVREARPSASAWSRRRRDAHGLAVAAAGACCVARRRRRPARTGSSDASARRRPPRRAHAGSVGRIATGLDARAAGAACAGADRAPVSDGGDGVPHAGDDWQAAAEAWSSASSGSSDRSTTLDRRDRLRVPVRRRRAGSSRSASTSATAGCDHVALRHAGLRGAAGQLPGDRRGRGAAGPLVPAGPRADARRTAGVAVLERDDVRVPHAAARHAQRPGHVASRDVPDRGAGQIDYSKRCAVPWGISESAYNARDLDGNYQYQGLRRARPRAQAGLGEDLVVAPYATMLAASLRPRDLIANLDALRRRGLWSSYGYYDAVDYTPGRACTPARAERWSRP